MSKDTGGPAFPQCVQYLNGNIAPHAAGMTLRDYFAAKALAGIWSNDELLLRLHSPGETIQKIARACYEMADAMLAERAKQ